MRRSSHHTGFTLLEVMVAMAILAIALVAVLSSQAQSISIANEARLLTTASMLAQSKIAEIESIGAETSFGDFGEDFPNYRWEVTTTDTDFKYLEKIDLVVTRKQEALTREYHITFYRYVQDNT
jgi:general secretion pathway protein I